MKFAYQPVARLPKQLTAGVVYHSEEFEVAALLCACGCGHRVMLLVPDSHQVTSNNGMATIRPSIAVCDAPCKSHYVVTNGSIEWLPVFSPAVASSVMRNQIARHVAVDASQGFWITRLRASLARGRAHLARVFNKLRSLFRM